MIDLHIDLVFNRLTVWKIQDSQIHNLEKHYVPVVHEIML